MLNDLTADDVANEISMSRSVFKGTYLVVEGATDARLYGKFMAEGTKIIAACSKSNVVSQIDMCGRRKDKMIIGIVDRDMDDMLGRRSNPPVFATDGRDMECMLIRSPALESVLSEYADRGKLERFAKNADGLRGRIAAASAPIGTLMYISYRNGLSLSFKDLDHSSFVDKDLDIDIQAMVDDVYSRSVVKAFPARTVAGMVADTVRDMDDLWKAVRGHDAVQVLLLGIKRQFGAYNAATLREDALQGALRMSFGDTDFAATELFRATSEFAQKNGMALWRITPAR